MTPIARDRARATHSPTRSPGQQSYSHLSYASYATPVRWADARGGASSMSDNLRLSDMFMFNVLDELMFSRASSCDA